MENQWLAYAKRLQAIAETGLAYCKDDFERERLEEIGTISRRMMAQLMSTPIEKIEAISADARGYATPKIDVRGAVISGGRILLVREKSNGLWTLPGGYADVGLSAAENVVKEVREEAGIVVRATALYALRHKAKGPFKHDARDFYKLYFLCEPIDATPPGAGAETDSAQFFPPDGLPALCPERVVEEDIRRAFGFDAAGGAAIFD